MCFQPQAARLAGSSAHPNIIHTREVEIPLEPGDELAWPEPALLAPLPGHPPRPTLVVPCGTVWM